MFIVYKTTNLITNEFYIGVHKTISEIFDGYYGSGLRLIRSLKKYGKDNFVRQTLYVFSDSDESIAFQREAEILLEKLHEPLCLNLGEGGKGGSNFKGHKHTDATKAKLSDIGKKDRNRNLTEQSKEKAKLTRLQKYNGQYHSEEYQTKLKGKKSAELKQKTSIGLKKHYSDPLNRLKHSIRLKEAFANIGLQRKGLMKNRIWMVNNITKHRIRPKDVDKAHYMQLGYIEGYKFDAG